MIPPCNAPPPTAGFLEGLLSYVDCQAQSIGANGYEALAAPGRPDGWPTVAATSAGPRSATS